LGVVAARAPRDGAVRIYNGIRELDGARTALQYSVTIDVLSYGLVGLAAGAAMALIGAGVVWSARASSRRVAHTLAILAALSAGAVALGGCYAYYESAPGVADRRGMRTKRVLAKREPDRLIAEDLTVCWVIPDVFAGIKPGDVWRCDWQVVPSGM
jgi:hypothetical protein